MQEKKVFNQNDYIREYNKKNYIQKKFSIRKEEKEKLDKVLLKYNMSLKSYVMKKVEEDLRN